VNNARWKLSPTEGRWIALAAATQAESSDIATCTMRPWKDASGMR